MKRVKKTVGKRFSRREIEQVSVDGVVIHLETIDWDGVFSADTIGRYKEKAVEVLRSKGVDVDSLLQQSPHGSGVRDYVLNQKNHAIDSVAGLAARVLEHALHIAVYKELNNGTPDSFIYTFGRLAMLVDVYVIECAIQAKRRTGKPSSDPYDTSRNTRLRQFYNRLIAGGATDATKQTAKEFSLSTKQVGRIIKQSGHNPDVS